VIDELQLGKKKDEETNYLLAEPLRKAWTTFDPMLAHWIQLLQCRLFTSFPICLVKLLEIWFNFLHHVHVHVKHGIVRLLVCDIMCTRSPNTFTLLLKNRQLAQWNFFYYVVPRCTSIHVIGAWEIHAWEVCNLFTRECLRNTPLNSFLVAHCSSKFFQFSFLTIHPSELHRSSNPSFPR
jgi:hypothetical protein